jgi:hypothetical protein
MHVIDLNAISSGGICREPSRSELLYPARRLDTFTSCGALVQWMTMRKVDPINDNCIKNVYRWEQRHLPVSVCIILLHERTKGRATQGRNCHGHSFAPIDALRRELGNHCATYAPLELDLGTCRWIDKKHRRIRDDEEATHDIVNRPEDS